VSGYSPCTERQFSFNGIHMRSCTDSRLRATGVVTTCADDRGHCLLFGAISRELEKAGHVMSGKYRKQAQPRAFNPATIKAMVEGPVPAKG